MVRVKVALEVIDREFIAALESTIVFRVHLNRIIGKMNVPRVQVIQIKLLRRRPKIAVAIHVTFNHAVYGSEQSVSPDIELSIVDEEWLVQILLND